MKKIIALAFSVGLVAGPFAALASADPVRDLSCQVQKKLGVDNVQQCDF